MPRYFLDSSALVKRYHVESGSAKVNTVFEISENRILISRLALVEVRSSFARLVREEILSEAEFSKLILRVQSDVASGLLNVAALSSQTMEVASEFLCTIGLKSPLRTLDAIQLVTAKVLQDRSHIEAFVAADKRLLASATVVCGMAVVDVSWSP